MISIIHPSRNRAEKSYQTFRKWIDRAGCEVQFLLAIDRDDISYGKYWELYHDDMAVMFEKLSISTGGTHNAIEAINAAAKGATQNILMVVSDDTDCPDNWAVDLLKEVEGKTDWILKTQDGIQPWLITMPVMDRTYYNRFGYIYHESYQHMFCDAELTCVAELTGRKLVSNMMFKHDHYSVTKAEKDEVSLKADETYESGKKIFIERKKLNFGLADQYMKGEMSSNHFTKIQ